MAIRMRNNKKQDSVCCECGDPRDEVLDMFDLCIGGMVFTICDVCNEILFNKTLSAECQKNHRVKDAHDMKILSKRATKDPKSKWRMEQELIKLERTEEKVK